MTPVRAAAFAFLTSVSAGAVTGCRPFSGVARPPIESAEPTKKESPIDNREWSVAVEKVVARVDEETILLSELRHRARPYRVRIHATVPPSDRKVQEGIMYRELLHKMVEEKLVEREAKQLGVTVSRKEFDDAIAQLAAVNFSGKVGALFVQANREGYSNAEYQAEIKRQILYFKMIQASVMTRVRFKENDVREYYHHLSFQAKKEGTVLPPYEEIYEEISARVRQESIEKRTQEWIGEMKSRAYVVMKL